MFYQSSLLILLFLPVITYLTGALLLSFINAVHNHLKVNKASAINLYHNGL